MRVWLDGEAGAHLFKVTLQPVNGAFTDRHKAVFFAFALAYCQHATVYRMR